MKDGGSDWYRDGTERLARRFAELVSEQIKTSPELAGTFDAGTPSRHAHQATVHSHLIDLLGPKSPPGVRQMSVAVGEAHIRSGIRPSWYVLAYNLLFTAYHQLESEGFVDLPPLGEVRESYLGDLGSTLDVYFETMRGNFRQEHAELSRTVSDLALQSRTDPLTNLLNRRAVTERLSDSTEQGAFILLDLDGFKAVNDTRGHMAGDRALCEIASVLQRGVRDSDLVARLGGDEFCIWSPYAGVDVWEHALTIVSRLAAVLPLLDWEVGISGGIVLSPEDGTGFDQLYDRADQALYRAKSSGWMSVCRWGTTEVEKL